MAMSSAIYSVKALDEGAIAFVVSIIEDVVMMAGVILATMSMITR